MTEKKYLELKRKIEETVNAGNLYYWDDRLYAEYEKAEHKYRMKRVYKDLNKIFAEGDWKSFCNQVLAYPESMPIAFMFYDQMPEEYRRDFVVGCYEHRGDSFPACRQALRGLKKNGINELPKKYRDKEYITVSRAGEEEMTKAPYLLSWSISRKVAEFFLNEYIGQHANYLYLAKIRPCDVIAYTNERKEQEILQYRKVYDIQILSVKE